MGNTQKNIEKYHNNTEESIQVQHMILRSWKTARKEYINPSPEGYRFTMHPEWKFDGKKWVYCGKTVSSIS